MQERPEEVVLELKTTLKLSIYNLFQYKIVSPFYYVLLRITKFVQLKPSSKENFRHTPRWMV